MNAFFFSFFVEWEARGERIPLKSKHTTPNALGSRNGMTDDDRRSHADATKMIAAHAKRWEKIGGRHAKNVQKCFAGLRLLGRWKIYFRSFRSPAQRMLRMWKLYYLRQRDGWETTEPKNARCIECPLALRAVVRLPHCLQLLYCNVHYRITVIIVMFNAVAAATSLRRRMNGRPIGRMDGREWNEKDNMFIVFMVANASALIQFKMFFFSGRIYWNYDYDVRAENEFRPQSAHTFL